MRTSSLHNSIPPKSKISTPVASEGVWLHVSVRITLAIWKLSGIIFYCTVTRIVRGLAQLASARGLGPRGRRFESFIPDQAKSPQRCGLFAWFEPRTRWKMNNLLAIGCLTQKTSPLSPTFTRVKYDLTKFQRWHIDGYFFEVNFSDKGYPVIHIRQFNCHRW